MKNAIKTHLALSILVIGCIILITISGCMQKKAIDKCVKKGHSYNYCIEHS